jgi:hypothetical protein
VEIATSGYEAEVRGSVRCSWCINSRLGPLTLGESLLKLLLLFSQGPPLLLPLHDPIHSALPRPPFSLYAVTFSWVGSTSESSSMLFT